MLKQWYSALELAEMKLLNMPTSDRRMREKAERENWPSRKRTGKGGGFEFMPPKSVLDLIKSKELSQAVVAQPSLPSLNTKTTSTDLTLKTTTTTLKDWQRSTAEARAAICAEVKRIAEIAGLDKAVMQLVNAASKGNLPEHIAGLVQLANAKSGKNGKRTLSRTSIYRWLKDQKEGFVALAPKSCEKIDIPLWAPQLLSLYSQPQKPSLAYCLAELQTRLPAHQVPSYSAANRFIKKLSNVDLQKGRMGARELKNIKPFVRRATDTMWPTEAYTADGHTFDAEVAHPVHGRPFRPETTTVLDIATRKAVGWSVGLAESTWSVLDALRHAVTSHGIPAIFYVDNGSGFKNALMNNEAVGFISRLSITATNSLPYNSQARGIEERSHQTIWVNAAKKLPTYMGKDMDPQAKQSIFKLTRKDIKANGKSSVLIGWLDFMAFCQAEIDNYNNRPHRALPKIYDEHGKKRHQTPNEAWQQAVQEGFEPERVTPEEADDLFRPYKVAITRRGEISLFTNTYFSHELTAYHGETMRVGYDIHDPSKVWVRNQAGQLVCIAAFEANKTRYFAQSFSDMAMEKRAKGRIARAQAKIEEAELELTPPQQLVQETAFEIPAVAVPSAEVLHIKTKLGRPAFSTDAQKYRWLQSNPQEITLQDEAWVNWYVLTDEYGDLFDDREVAAR